MSKTEAQQVFDTILSLGYNESIELSFPLDTAAESFRSALYRERKNWAMSSGSKDQIQITRKYTGFPFKLEVTKVPGMMSAVIKKQDGSVTELTFKEPVEQPEFIEPVDDRSELDRQKDLMRNDGMSDEEIADYFKEDLE